MSRTYIGMLREDRIEWVGERPAGNGRGRAVPVRVTIEENAADTSSGVRRGEKMADALRSISEGSCALDLPDPVAWQRESRRENPPAGRDE